MKKKSGSRSAWPPPSGRHAAGFLANLEEIQKEFQATTRRGDAIPIEKGFAESIRLIFAASKRGNKLVFIGNGGSAAIASHQAVDYWKNGGIESIAFNDASLLTCIGNDCGYENVFSKPTGVFAKKGDVMIAISSSGRSPNILNGAKAARAKGCSVITLSGFDAKNELRTLGDVNFYVPVRAYGLVEISHLTIIHAMLREIIYLNPNVDKRGY